MAADRRLDPEQLEKGRALCPSFGRCGGCSYLGLSQDEELKIKEKEVLDCLTASGIDASVFRGIVKAPSESGYRNKMEFTFGNEVKDGPTLLGLHAKKSFISIVPADGCVLVPEDFRTILKNTLSFCLDKGYIHYNKKTHDGLLRSLVLRRGVRTGELLVNIVTSSRGKFDEDGYKDNILSSDLKDRIVGIIHTVNDNRSDAIIAEDVRLLYGRPYYNEEILGLKFKVGAFSFFQTNVEAAERIYRDAISLLPSLENKTVFDLYCGTGTMTQAMALKAYKAIGVEIVEEAVRTAEEAARINGLDNCSFIAGDVGEVLSGLSVLPDVIMVDPPRPGIAPKALQKILSYGVETIVYVSCNPKTLAENLRAAELAGYSIVSVTAYDNFCYTKHIESIALLSLKKL
ncbi:MAG: 23S rRNA (uracil(1939)-C(5))-methyltransferase RlmD [Firmicutes bacterium]|nr:23S rRNA (uracil(1939)-C(5))-methyltransferase RlmD [Bacillota bacterium]